MGSKIPLLLSSGSLGIVILIAIAAVVFFFLKPKKPSTPTPSTNPLATLEQQLGGSLGSGLGGSPSGTCPQGATTEWGVTCPGYAAIPDDPTQTFETMQCLAWQCYSKDTCSEELCLSAHPAKYAKWYYIDQCGNYVFPTADVLQQMNQQAQNCQKEIGIISSIIGVISGILDPELGIAIQLGWAASMTGLQTALKYAIKDGVTTSSPTAQSGTGLSFGDTTYGTGKWWTVKKLIDRKLGLTSGDYVPDPPPNWELIANPDETFVYQVANDGNGNISDACNSNCGNCPTTCVDQHLT